MHAHLLWPMLIFELRLDHAHALTGHAMTAKLQAAACQEYSAAHKPFLMQSSVLGRIPAAATGSITSTGPWRSASLALHEDEALSQYCTTDC